MSKNDPAAPSPFAHPGVDWPTLGLLAAMWAGLAGNAAWAVAHGIDGVAQGLLHVLVGVLFLNLSFTVWHEGVHRTAFRGRLANDVLGVLGSWPALLPYFLIRRDHLLHHEHTNDPERDPDFWFTEGSIWTLPLRYPAGMRRARDLVRATGPPAWERRADAALLAAALALMVAAVATGHAWALVCCWLVPKGIAMWIHAWYVNVLPHRGLPPGRFQGTRVLPIRWLAPFLLCHNYHGLHHAWQTVPWHRYRRAFELKRSFLEERGTPVRDSLFRP